MKLTSKLELILWAVICLAFLGVLVLYIFSQSCDFAELGSCPSHPGFLFLFSIQGLISIVLIP